MDIIDIREQPVTRRALLRRINRRLAREGERVLRARGQEWHYLINDNNGFLGRVELEEIAADLGVLGLGEKVAAT